MLGTILNAQLEQDGAEHIRSLIFKYLNDADAMSTCLVSKGAYVAESSWDELDIRCKAALHEVSEISEALSESVHELVPNSTILVLKGFIKYIEKNRYASRLDDSRMAMSNRKINWEFRCEIEEMVKEAYEEAAGVIEKQALQIVALKRLYKAK